MSAAPVINVASHTTRLIPIEAVCRQREGGAEDGPALRQPALLAYMIAILRAGLFVGLAATTAAGDPGQPPGNPSGPQRVAFSRSIANLEYLAEGLEAARPRQVLRAPEGDGELFYGLIPRRLSREEFRERGHFVPFIVRYALDMPTRAWCDSNLNGDLTDDPSVPLSAYPGIEGARSFLAELGWMARSEAREIPVKWTVRVVLERGVGGDSGPVYRLQMVHGLMGVVTLEGKPHRAVLYDGNGDGLFTRGFADGVFVDLDDDLYLDVDPMSHAFGPFGVPFQMGRRIYEVESVDLEGRELVLWEKAVVEAVEPARVGKPAPDFSYRDLQGRQVRLSDYAGRVVLVYFWSSWCGACEAQAGDLRALYDRYHGSGLEILGVSYDADRSAMAAFRLRHGHTWPTSFSGRSYWEDPVGRLYQAYGSGLIYMVDRMGRLDGTYINQDEVAARLEHLIPREEEAAAQ